MVNRWLLIYSTSIVHCQYSFNYIHCPLQDCTDRRMAVITIKLTVNSLHHIETNSAGKLLNSARPYSTALVVVHAGLPVLILWAMHLQAILLVLTYNLGTYIANQVSMYMSLHIANQHVCLLHNYHITMQVRNSIAQFLQGSIHNRSF